jgi:hypothetical protein
MTHITGVSPERWNDLLRAKWCSDSAVFPVMVEPFPIPYLVSEGRVGTRLMAGLYLMRHEQAESISCGDTLMWGVDLHYRTHDHLFHLSEASEWLVATRSFVSSGSQKTLLVSAQGVPEAAAGWAWNEHECVLAMRYATSVIIQQTLTGREVGHKLWAIRGQELLHDQVKHVRLETDEDGVPSRIVWDFYLRGEVVAERDVEIVEDGSGGVCWSDSPLRWASVAPFIAEENDELPLRHGDKRLHRVTMLADGQMGVWGLDGNTYSVKYGDSLVLDVEEGSGAGL